MKKLLISALCFLGCVTSVFAGSAPDGAYFTDDGSHWATVTRNGDKDVLTIDGVTKATYAYMDQPYISGNSFYTIGTDASNMKYVLKDGVVVDKWTYASVVTNYTSYQKLEWWYVVGDGTFRLRNAAWVTILENMNAWSSSYSSSIANGLIQTTLYSRNNDKATTYLNDKKIAGNAYSIGTYKNGKKMEIFYTTTNDDGTTGIFAYNVTTWTLRSLPWYDGVGTYATIVGKSGYITELQYSVLVNDKYAIVDINGKFLSSSRYDEVTQITTYGNKFYKSFVKDGKSFFFFDGKVYGGYDEIDSFNVSYNPSNYSYVSKWSIFTKKGGKDYIIANGKEFQL